MVSGHKWSCKVLLDNSFLESFLGGIELGATEKKQVLRLDSSFFVFFVICQSFGKHFILKTVRKNGYLAIEDCHILRLVKVEMHLH